MAIYGKIVFIAKVWLVLYYIKAKLSKALKQEDLRWFLHLKNPFAMHSNTWTKIFLNSYICNHLFFIGINVFVLWEFYSIEIILLRWGIWSMSLLNKMCLWNTDATNRPIPKMAKVTRTNILIPVERSYHKKWLCTIWYPLVSYL